MTPPHRILRLGGFSKSKNLSRNGAGPSQQVRMSGKRRALKRYSARRLDPNYPWASVSSKSGHFFCTVCKRDFPGGENKMLLHESTLKHVKLLDSEQISRNITFVYKNSSPNNLPTVDLTDEPDGSENDESHFIVSDPTKKRRRTEVIMDVKMEVKATSKMRESAPSRFDVKPKLKSPIVMRTEKVLMPFNTAKLRKMQAVTPFYSAEGYKSPSPKSQREIEGDANDYHDEDTTPPNHLTVEYEDRTPKEEYILSPNHDKFLQSRGSEDNLELMTIIEKKLDSSLVSDPFDVFGKHIANKLRTLTPEQNRFAQKLVMDVLFEGEMENLDRNTKVVKCGVSCMCT